MDAIHFFDYDKITDTLMFFTQTVALKFGVNLSKTKNDKRYPFHNEYAYMSNGHKAYSIKRSINCWFLIDDSNNFENNILIRPQDVTLLQLLLTNNVIPWIIGENRIYGMNDENRLILKGKFTKVDFPLSDYKFISFLPIVIEYTDNTSKEGIRLIINNKDNMIDININQFLEFYYYIMNVDMYSAATNLLNYVKMKPYGENMYDMTIQSQSARNNNEFFKNLK